MASVIHYNIIENTTDAPLNPTNSFADNGDKFAEQALRRIFSADDIGTDLGQTRDNNNPTLGCVIASYTGSRIYALRNVQLFRREAATVTQFNFNILGSGANTAKIGLNVIYNKKNGISTILLIDKAADAPGQIVEDDWIELDVLLGSSSNPDFPPLG